MAISYEGTFFSLVGLSSLLLISQPTRAHMLRAQAGMIKKKHPNAELPPHSKKHPQRTVYKVYFFMVTAAWLHEIFINNVYRLDYNLSSETIFQLNLTNFVTAGIVSTFAGAFADKYGRKSTNVLFTASYGAAACMAMIPETPALFAGRFLSGVGQAVMFSVLDSWIVGDFFARKLITQGCDLFRTFGTLGVINSFSAVICAVLGERLVWATGYNKAPLVLSWLLMWQAMQAVWSKMREAYGAVATDDLKMKENTPALSNFYRRPYIWALTASATVFEGSAILFAFNAVPLLKSVRKNKADPQMTYLFACIMTSALAGALAFNIVMVRKKIRFVRLMSVILLAANFVFWQLARVKTERNVFWLLNAFGGLIGLYYPCAGTLKARLVDEGIRSTVFSLLRAPTYAFVVAQLLLHQDDTSTTKFFSSSSWWFTGAFAIMWLISFHNKLP